MSFKIRGVIVDLDGTLIDSRRAHALAWKKTLDEEGVRNTLEEIEKCMGCDVNQLLAQLAGVEARSKRGQRLTKRKSDVLESEFMSRIKPSPFSKDLLARLKAEGLRFTLMSSANSCELNTFLNILDCSELLETQGKCEFRPASMSPIEAAMANLSMNAEEIILIGNTPYDIQAALSHGVKAVAFRSGGWSDQDLAGALAIYDDISGLLKKFEQSPFSKKAISAAPSEAA